MLFDTWNSSLCGALYSNAQLSSMVKVFQIIILFNFPPWEMSFKQLFFSSFLHGKWLSNSHSFSFLAWKMSFDYKLTCGRCMNWLMIPDNEIPLRASESMFMGDWSASVGISISGLDNTDRSGNLQYVDDNHLSIMVNITILLSFHCIL